MLYVPPQFPVSWTDDRVEHLTKLYIAGFSGSQIAKELGGTTRNAVIGKINRMGLNTDAMLTEPEKAERHARKFEADRLRQERAALKAKRRSRLTSTPTLYEAFVKRPVDDLAQFSKNIPFIELEPHHCRFSFGKGPYLFCGNDKQDNSSYCPGHHAICCVEAAPYRPKARVYHGTNFSAWA